MIRIISRKVPLGSSVNFGLYVNKLSELVKKQPGFIKSESFWCRDSDNIFSMSDWESEKQWEKWLKSEERREIIRSHRNYVQEEHFHTFHKTNNRFHNFFLL
jgi:heme-degrading monooxygenase HmoA